MWSAGSPRVEGDEEEDDIDDLDNEFDYGNFVGLGPHEAAEAMLSARLNTGRGHHSNASGIPSFSERETSPLSPDIPLLTYGEEVNQFESSLLYASPCVSTYLCSCACVWKYVIWWTYCN